MAMNTLPPLESQWTQAFELIDAVHAQDPNLTVATGTAKTLPYELHYAMKMTSWLAKRAPQASPTLQVACRAQHFRRWELPRSSFPMGRSGYLTWRSKQKSQASTQVFDLLGTPSITPAISEADKERVALLIRKGNLTTDEETQILEDVACLVFLDDQFDDFERKADMEEEKMINILRKTWAKMSESGRQLALGMDLSEKAKTLIGKALQS
ncbi:glutamyl-tRNA synthetase [Emericellopsis atlantica]|uniref:Glutamyl-tRNA synthetase n=1 Tax=Emericellopsis atlantica TaxID=2614577 RepID=A0A9P7ZVB2_9HYPO|nr:glutamyl-tRNA synthetase [Emericellopsis atlantica]KAG9258318.1 glutamyl-tRNA synthetase [Emericellopsis atlantica]